MIVTPSEAAIHTDAAVSVVLGHGWVSREIFFKLLGIRVAIACLVVVDYIC